MGGAAAAEPDAFASPAEEAPSLHFPRGRAQGVPGQPFPRRRAAEARGPCLPAMGRPGPIRGAVPNFLRGGLLPLSLPTLLSLPVRARRTEKAPAKPGGMRARSSQWAGGGGYGPRTALTRHPRRRRRRRRPRAAPPRPPRRLPWLRRTRARARAATRARSGTPPGRTALWCAPGITGKGASVGADEDAGKAGQEGHQQHPNPFHSAPQQLIQHAPKPIIASAAPRLARPPSILRPPPSPPPPPPPPPLAPH
jgi:hypothetical protein